MLGLAAIAVVVLTFESITLGWDNPTRTWIAAIDHDLLGAALQLGTLIAAGILAYVGWRRVLAADAQAESATQAVREQAEATAASTEQAAVARASLTTTQFATAVGQLASNETTERLGGIYTLERLAVDHPFEIDPNGQADAGAMAVTITQLLCGFVVNQTPRPEVDINVGLTSRPSRTTDVAAALVVLGRLPKGCSHHIDLSQACLTGAKMPGANLQGATLTGAWLQGADLFGADLTRADFTNANLSNASLVEADIPQTRFHNTDLTGANLRGVLKEFRREAIWIGADLKDVTLPDDWVWDEEWSARHEDDPEPAISGMTIAIRGTPLKGAQPDTTDESADST